MPKLKQPASLESTVMDYLVKFVIRFYDDLQKNGPSERFLQGTSAFTEHIRNQMHGLILTEFIRRFKETAIDRTYGHKWYTGVFEFSLNMLMDVGIEGLDCDESILSSLKPWGLRRLKGLAKINLYYDYIDVPQILKNCPLNDITSLLLSHQCRDKYLAIIGKNCPKLRVFKVPDTDVTDKGLRFLQPCKELRVVDVIDCQKVSHFGINRLISVHEKLAELFYGKGDESVDDCHFLSRMDKPCLTMKRFSIKTKVVSHDHLCMIAAMFPNLSDLGLNCEPIRDFPVLKSLSHLSGIDLEVTGWHSTRDLQSVWESLQELFKLIGPKITFLRLRSFNERCVMDRRGLKFLYDHCPNIETLKCEYMSTLVVPPFPKLKHLQLLAHGDDDVAFDVNQFGTMLNLEILQLVMIILSFDNLKSMVLDDEKFPKLKIFQSKCPLYDDEINCIAKQNNLDFNMGHCIVD